MKALPVFKSLFYFVVLSLGILSCKTGSSTLGGDDGKITIQILQLNDVYEISPMSDGKGGMARVATVKKELLQNNPNTIAVLAGDFVSPSVIGTLKYEGTTIRGKQMIEVMNAAGIDLVTFGNHEFDIKESEIQQRIDESTFEWVSTNVSHVTGNTKTNFLQRGKPILRYKIYEFKDQDGTSVKMGVMGLTLPANKQDFVFYEDFFEAAKSTFKQIQGQVDFVIAITHLNATDDVSLAATLPEMPLIIGGHDHSHMYIENGKSRIAKADANAKTVYIHSIQYNKKNKKTSVGSKLKTIDASIASDPATEAVVKKWNDIAQASLKSLGFDAAEKLYVLNTPLDARESMVRYKPSPVAEIVTSAMTLAAPDADCAILNCGSIRIDDVLSGAITQYDVIRLLPFGGKLAVVDMKGKLLGKIVKTGLTANVGNGGYLALGKCSYDAATQKVTVGSLALDDNKIYKVVMPEYLLTGKEYNLDYLTKDNPDIRHVKIPAGPEDKLYDIRNVVISYLRTL